jgi:hypothetical protein
MDHAHVEPLPDNEADAVKYGGATRWRPWPPPPLPFGLTPAGYGRHAFLLVDGDGKRHVYCAENDEERQAWVEVLGLHIEMMQPTTLARMLGPEATGSATGPETAHGDGDGDGDGNGGGDGNPAMGEDDAEVAGEEEEEEEDDESDDGVVAGGGPAGAGGGAAAVAATTSTAAAAAAVERAVLMDGVLYAKVGVIGRFGGVKPHYCELWDGGILAYYRTEHKDGVRSAPLSCSLCVVVCV